MPADNFDYARPGGENVELLQALIDDAESYTKDTHSRNAEILKSIINNTEYTDPPQSEIEELLLELKAHIAAEVEVDPLIVDANGEYDAGLNKAFNPVTVQLPLSSKTITANGTYTAEDEDLAGYSEVTVDVDGYQIKSLSNTPTSIATITDGTALPMPSLKVGIEAVQSGSGTPSSDNIRHINGFNKINIANSKLVATYGSKELCKTITFPWADGNNNYDMEMNVCMYEKATLHDSSEINVATLESNYVLPFDCVYDEPEAIVALDENQTLSAGDYYFKIANDSWGNNNGKYVCFTLASDLEPPYQIRKKSGAYDAAIENCTLGIYTSGADRTGTTLAFTVETTQPSSGTDLGQTDGTGYCNYWHCVVLGYNRWKCSAIRQFLNSDATAGNWWTQQHKWDVMPAYATSKNGFLYGLSASVKEHIKETKVVTARNTVFNSGDTPLGGNDETYDKVFLISLEQSYINPQATGEGRAWEYYQQLNGTSTKYAQYGTYADLIKYDIGAKTTARSRWLRSAFRGNACSMWYVYASGYVYSGNATYGHRVAPCLRIGIDNTQITLDDTYYGASLDVITGKLTKTWGHIASYNGESLPSRWISDRDVYVEGTTPTTGAEVIYELATPTTTQLTPTQISTINGTNNIFADCGEILEGSYFAEL